MKKTTLCYIDNNGSWLMLYRNKKPDDPNEGKWLGIGGKIEPGETPDECNKREVLEETGLILLNQTFHGVIKFRATTYENEDMYLYSSGDFEPADEAAKEIFTLPYACSINMPKEENNYDWRQFFRNDDIKLKGEEPDFSEDGWARRKPKKK